ncbi:MAG: hypothetical protein FWC87_04050 [Acidimicrobiaceae bacterium]|nr:hypothetical protein [Acidimicrobiaceae bacterium]
MTPSGVIATLGDYNDVVAGNFYGIGRNIVGERIQRSTRDEVEAGMVPVAGEQTLLDGAAMKGKTQVGAAIFDGVRLLAGPEDAHRLRPDFAGEVAL